MFDEVVGMDMINVVHLQAEEQSVSWGYPPPLVEPGIDRLRGDRTIGDVGL